MKAILFSIGLAAGLPVTAFAVDLPSRYTHATEPLRQLGLSDVKPHLTLDQAFQDITGADPVILVTARFSATGAPKIIGLLKAAGLAEVQRFREIDGEAADWFNAQLSPDGNRLRFERRFPQVDQIELQFDADGSGRFLLMSTTF